jgi:hypothetical protein
MPFALIQPERVTMVIMHIRAGHHMVHSNELLGQAKKPHGRVYDMTLFVRADNMNTMLEDWLAQ